MTLDEQITIFEHNAEFERTYGFWQGYLDYRQLAEWLKDYRSILSEQKAEKWIPVSERLPEEDGDYFVTLENGVVTKLGYSTTQRTTYPKGFYYISNGFSWIQTINSVTAWMLSPEPYKAESEDDVIKRKAGTPREDYMPLYNCENWIP